MGPLEERGPGPVRGDGGPDVRFPPGAAGACRGPQLHPRMPRSSLRGAGLRPKSGTLFFTIKGQTVNVSGSVDHTVPVATTQLSEDSTQAAVDDSQVNGHSVFQ